MEHYSSLEVVAPAEGLYLREDSRPHPETLSSKPEGTFPEATPVEYHKISGIQAVPGHWESPPGQPLPSNSADNLRRKCGLPIRTFYIILVVVAVVAIGAIAGGIAGGLSSSKSHHSPTATPTATDIPTDDGNSTSPPPNQPVALNILEASRLSSTNWTDQNGFFHRFVFFQDPSNAIIARRWDSQNNTWSTNNLTDIFRQTRTPLNPLAPYTPLASAACYFSNKTNEVHLYYLAPDNTITGVAVYDLIVSPEQWQYDTLGDSTLVAASGSQLAAAWTRCWADDCPGHWALAYQRIPDYGINVANSSNFGSAPRAIESGRVAQNSSLAMIPEIQIGGTSVTRLTLLSESLSSPSSGQPQKTTYKTSWSADGQLFDGAAFPVPSPALQFAMSRLDDFAAIVFLALLPNGTVRGEYFPRGGTFIEIPSVDFRGNPSPVNFSAIAASEDATFYGISADEILQYSINATDPSIFNFVERVYP
ncbi:hypothetical protein GGR51DRAFT_75953 [Nemania sp. FL0031]|nr:hypothetical protein GGR51DRAFT_75953 [Nemania sp. FL0031]